ncbi:VW5B1 protein, partial [Psilopogon haemacephalus]|nr:VW5B1 protein [Psilopogon haemacephalus]
VQWEVTFDIHPLFRERQGQADGDTDLWSETFHHLAAKSVIRDLEQLAEKEAEIEHGSGRRYQVSAVHTSKACNIISKYTAFVPVDLSTNNYLPSIVEYPHMGKVGVGRGCHEVLGGRLAPGKPCLEQTLWVAWGYDVEESNLPACSTSYTSAWECCQLPEGSLQSLSAASAPAPKSTESLFAPRLTLDKTRLLIRAAKGFMSKSPSRGSEASSEGDNENIDYLPLASLQLACGAFLLNSAFCDAVSIPMEKLKWTSPFACHRLALSPSSSSSARHTSPSGEQQSLSPSQQLLVPDGQGKSRSAGGASSPSAALPDGSGRLRHFSGSAVESISRALKAEKELSPPAITIRRFSSPEWQAGSSSSRGSEVDGSKVQQLLLDVELQRQTEPEGMLWATAVALAWLEHSSASYFIEWELVAAKASLWLSQQRFPEGSSLAAVKAAAQQLFVLLRHWDEKLEFNLLCYNPSSV